MIKKFPVFFVWLCFKFQSRFLPTESSQAKNFGFPLFSCRQFCYIFWLRKTFDRCCCRKILLNRFFQQTLRNYFKSFRKYWYSRPSSTITSYYAIKELTWKKLKIISTWTVCCPSVLIVSKRKLFLIIPVFVYNICSLMEFFIQNCQDFWSQVKYIRNTLFTNSSIFNNN